MRIHGGGSRPDPLRRRCSAGGIEILMRVIGNSADFFYGTGRGRSFQDACRHEVMRRGFW